MAVVDPTRDVENDLIAAGYDYVIGVDEVGRGAIGGPVGVGVALFVPSLGEHPAGLRDSKMVSEKKRLVVEPAVREWTFTGVGYASADEVDAFGITEALSLAGGRALEELREHIPSGGRGVILLDGDRNWLKGRAKGLPVVTRVKGDRDCVCVAAASIVAKVARDNLMIELAESYPGYGFEGHKGYGAAKHYEAIKTLGVVDGVHRKTWIK